MQDEHPQKMQTKRPLKAWFKSLLLLTVFILFVALFVHDVTDTTQPKHPWWWYIH